MSAQRLCGFLFLLLFSWKPCSVFAKSDPFGRCPEFLTSPPGFRMAWNQKQGMIYLLLRDSASSGLFPRPSVWLASYEFRSSRLTYIRKISATDHSILLYWPEHDSLSLIQFTDQGWWCKSGAVLVQHYRMNESTTVISSPQQDPVQELAVLGNLASGKQILISPDQMNELRLGPDGLLEKGQKLQRGSAFPVMGLSGDLYYLAQENGTEGRYLRLYHDPLRQQAMLPQKILGMKVASIGKDEALLATTATDPKSGLMAMKVAELKGRNAELYTVSLPDMVRSGQIFMSPIPEKDSVLLIPSGPAVFRQWQRIFMINYKKKEHILAYPWEPDYYPVDVWYSRDHDQLLVPVRFMKSDRFAYLNRYSFKDKKWEKIIPSEGK